MKDFEIIEKEKISKFEDPITYIVPGNIAELVEYRSDQQHQTPHQIMLKVSYSESVPQ